MPQKTIESVLKEHRRKLLALHGVVGVAIGSHKGKPCIVVYISEKTSDVLKHCPAVLEGYEVVVEESGDFFASTLY